MEHMSGSGCAPSAVALVPRFRQNREHDPHTTDRSADQSRDRISDLAFTDRPKNKQGNLVNDFLSSRSCF